MAIFEGFADSLKKGPQAASNGAKKKVTLPQKKGGLFSGFADSLKAKASAPKPVTAPPTPPAVALSPVLTKAANYLPKVNTPVTTAPVPNAPAAVTSPITPPQAPTLAPGPRVSAMPPSTGPKMTPEVAAKFGPLINKGGSFLPKVIPKAPETISAPKKDTIPQAIVKGVAKAAPLVQKSLAGPGAWFAPDISQKSAQQVVDDTIGGIKRGSDLTQEQYKNFATKSTDFYKKAYLNPNATNAEKSAAAIDFAASLIADVGGGTAQIGLEAASGFSPLFKGLKEGVLDKGSEYVMKAGEFAGEKGVEALPVSRETKDLIKAPTQRLLGAGLMALVFHKAVKAGNAPRVIEDMKRTPLSLNDVVSSAKNALDINEGANPKLQQSRLPLAEIRTKFDEFTKDKTPKEVEIAETAKQVLEDYAKLSKQAFEEKYKAPIETVQVASLKVPTIKDIETPRTPETPRAIAPEAPKVTPEPIKAVPVATGAIPSKISAPKVTAPKLTAASITKAVDSKSSTPKTSLRVATIKTPKATTTVSKPVAVKFDSKNLRHTSVLTDVLGAENAARIANTGDLSSGVIFGRRPSSLPKWIPSELRRGPLVKSVMQHINDGTLPVRAAENQLYRVITNRMAEPEAPKGTKAPSPFGQGQSKVGKSIEAKAIEKKMTDSFSDTASYEKINIKDQANRAADLINTDLEGAKRMLKGDEPIPEGLRAESLILALEEHAMKSKDAQLALDVARSPLTAETSVHAQAMRILAERDPDSAVAAIQRLKKMKEEAAGKLKETKANVIKDIKESVNKVKKAKATKETWGSFIESITC